MTRAELRNALCVLHSLDAHELRGVPANRARAFMDDPARQYLRADDETEAAIWEALQTRVKPKRPNPAATRRHPPGCPDGDWCRGNGCWWDCEGRDIALAEERARLLPGQDDTAIPVLSVPGGDASYQGRVMAWLLECFGSDITNDRAERVHRFWEEALELGQSAGCTAAEAHQLVDYVFGRPAGELSQEVGGTLVCLAALCTVHDIDMDAEGERELARVWTKVEKIRAKHAAKPKFSPLPGSIAPGGEGA